MRRSRFWQLRDAFTGLKRRLGLIARDPLAPLSDFTATIDWGDGTPLTAGTISQPVPGGAFIVSGSHTYADSGVNGGVIALDGKGETNLAKPTADGVREPLNRRATIDINF